MDQIVRRRFRFRDLFLVGERDSVRVRVDLVALVVLVDPCRGRTDERSVPASPAIDHVVNLNVTVSYALVRNGTDPPGLAVNVTVPRVRNGTSACPSAHLIDTIDPTTPILPATEISYVASVDRLGEARTPCSILDFSYDPSTFGYESELNATSSRWRLARVDSTTATYETIDPFVFDDLVASCGATHETVATPLLGASYPTQRYAWSIHACQVGHYGPRCESSFGEYAATCARATASARLGPMVSTIATGVETLARSLSGEIAFAGFDTTDAGGCRVGMREESCRSRSHWKISTSWRT